MFLDLFKRDYYKIKQPPEAVQLDTLPQGKWAFIWLFVMRDKWKYLTVMFFFLASSALDALPPVFIKYVLDAITELSDPSMIWDALKLPIILFVILCLFLQPLCAQIGEYFNALHRPYLTNKIRRSLSLYLQKHSYDFFQNDFAGRLSSKVIETPQAIIETIQIIIGSILYGTTSFVVTLIFFAKVGWVVPYILLVWLVAYIILLIYFVPRILKCSTAAYESLSQVRGRSVDTITNIYTVKLFSRWRREDSYLVEGMNHLIDKAQIENLLNVKMRFILEMISALFVGGMFFVGIYGWTQGILTPGDVAMILPMAIRIMQTSWWMQEVSVFLFQNLGQVDEGLQTINKPLGVQDREDAEELNVASGAIEFRDVNFKYGDNPVFKNLDISIKPGEKIGLVGTSGAGKSTLTQVLLRFYDVTSGGVFIDDQNIACVTRESLREHIGMIPQANDLLHRSIEENIRYGRLGATREDIVQAAKDAYAYDFILDLVDKDGRTGFDAYVGERGVRLSGGQRQRIAIARALLKNAPILILDEATSALDSESEQLIQNSMKSLMDGKTVIAIAHRLSTIAHMDRLLVMEDGGIIEQGSHDDLLKKGGHYAKLWKMQSGGFL